MPTNFYTMSELEKNKLSEMFKNEVEDIIEINKETAFRYKSDGCKAIVFDFDGVLLKEIGIAELGYAWAIRALRDGIFDPTNIELHFDDIDIAQKYRTVIKGKPMTEKLDILRQRFGNKCINIGNDEIITLWYDFFTYYVQFKYSKNEKEYLLPGALELIKKAYQCGKVFGVTANEQRYALWIMNFVGLREYFKEIVGYPIHTLHNTSKGSLLNDLLFRWGIRPNEACYIGDGSSDIQAGMQAGVLTIGIANNEIPISYISCIEEKERVSIKAFNNAIMLAEAGCDILATSPMAYPSIAAFFAQPCKGINSVSEIAIALR